MNTQKPLEIISCIDTDDMYLLPKIYKRIKIPGGGEAYITGTNQFENARIIASSFTRAGGWQDIETAPRDGTHILVYNRDRLEPEVAWYDSLCDNNIYPWLTWSNGYKEKWPLHWQALPAAPEGK